MTTSRFLMIGARHRLPVLLFLAALTYMAVLGLPRLRVDTGFGNLIPNTALDQALYKRICQEFGPDNRTVIYVRDSELWSLQKLAALEEMHHALEGLGFVERVDDLFNARTVRSVGGRIASRLVLPGVPRDEAEIHRLREQALSDPLVTGTLLSRDGLGTAFLLSLRGEKEDGSFERRVEEGLARVLSPFRSAFEEVFHLGPTRFNQETGEGVEEELGTLGPLSAAALALLVLLFLRSAFAAALLLFTAGLSITWTLGMMGWAGIPLNLLCVMLPSLVLAVGSAEDVRMFASYFRGLSQAQAENRASATRFMMSHTGATLVLTGLTITMAFASSVFSSIGLIRDFALAAAFAVVSKGVVTLLFVPMALSVMGPRRTGLFHDPERPGGPPGHLPRVSGLAGGRLQGALVIVTVLLGAFFVYQLSTLRVTSDPLSYLSQDHPLVRDTRQIHRDLAGPKTFFITLESDTDKAFQRPRNLEKLVTIQEFLQKQGIFDRSLSLADPLSLVNRELNGGDPEHYRIPERRELVAQYLLFFHRRDLEGYVSHDLRRANIVVRHNVADSGTLNRHIQELREVLSGIARGEMTAHVVGENLMINAAAEGLLSDQVRSLAILLCVIFLIMSAMFTSFKGGLVSLLPNLVPVSLMFGLMALLGIPLNPQTLMVAAIAVGVGIGGTLHLILRYNDLCRRTAHYEEAVRAAIREEAPFLVATYFALAVGFGILLLSRFNLVAQFGGLSAVAMVFALFADRVITPVILSRTRLVGLHQIWSLSVHKEILQRSPLFQGMSDYQIRKTILISELKEFREGDLLVEQGTFGRSMFMVLAGQVEVARRTDGKTQRIALMGPGQVFGEVGYINEIERTADVRALTHVETLRFDYRKLRRDLKFFPSLVANLNFNISCILGERLAGAMGALYRPREEPLRPDSERIPGTLV